MGCRYVQAVGCQDLSRCSTCVWCPDVSRRRRAMLRDAQRSRRKVMQQLRDYQKQYSQRCFAPLALQIGGRVDEALLRDISVGYVPWLPEADWDRIGQVLDLVLGEEG